MELYNQKLMPYLESLIPTREAELASMESYGLETSFPIIGPVAGQFCYAIARMLGAQKVFEMGSGYGYSTAWFAKAIHEYGGGEVTHVVWDADLSQQAQRHLETLGYQDIVRYEVGEAIAVLREERGPFDVIFMDIDKDGYPGALPVIAEKLRPGGALIADNMFLGGLIFDEVAGSPSWEGVRQFTAHITTDPSWMCSIIPIRDGLMLAVKI